jgi:hypothetical protein
MMKVERSKVEFPLWRKKVDSSLFEYSGTTIPTWACTMWRLQEIFGHCISSQMDDSKVKVVFQDKDYLGNVTVAKKGRKTPAYRLWFDDDLVMELKHKYLMSYMRSLEKRLRTEAKEDIEKEIPFWEFLDIEFDPNNKVFGFEAYYRQEPSFPELFKRLIGSPSLKQIDDELYKKGAGRIYKQSWKAREMLEFELGARNVIYMLIDTENKLLYVGEAQDLAKRLNKRYPSIPKWNYYRYDVLPPQLSAYRVAIERMLIRGYAELLENKGKIDFKKISSYTLANDKVDIR